ncbi:D-3-phosphoglycerate dehydrogenase [hydrothermal vent metagenome]|uniref:D-3-phosphoglycerate dehydrogenase n=1 Tax=hydrothermal vent metagenome TaxID=652676 RepID=A0A3B0TA35_9ZZZZ
MTKPEILVRAPFMPYVLDQIDAAFDVRKSYLADDPEAFIDEVAPNISGLAGWGGVVDRALIDRLPNLEIIANFGVGYDGVDAKYAASRGIVVTNTPDVLTEEVADIALALLIMAARELTAAERHLRAGNWEKDGDYPLTTGTLRGRTVGIAGMGRIGKAVARRIEALGLKLAYFGRTRQAGISYPFYDNLAAMAADVDTIVAVLPGGEATRHLFNEEVFKALGPTGIFVNIGRGTSVDEVAMVRALESGAILNAGLDVYEDEPSVPAELVAMNKVVLLPHVASASVHTRNAMGQLVVDNFKSWFETGKALTPVPETPNPA